MSREIFCHIFYGEYFCRKYAVSGRSALNNPDYIISPAEYILKLIKFGIILKGKSENK